MHPIIPSIPEFEGYRSKELLESDTVSITGPDLKKTITIHTITSPPEQLIKDKYYTKIHLKDLEDGTVSELYVETSKIQELISKSSSFSSSNLPPPRPKKPAQTSAAVAFEDLEKESHLTISHSPFSVTNPISHSPFIVAEPIISFPESGLPEFITTVLKTNTLASDSFYKIETTDQDYIFHEHEWHAIIAKPPKGTDAEVLVCRKFAFKFLHSQTGWTELKRSEAILERINPDGTSIGIPKRPITELASRNLTVYSVSVSGEVNIAHNPIRAQLEEVFQSDCLAAIDQIQTSEIQSIAACVVQGSKTLIENGIYHLDTKLENIGYLGNGRAIHFDLGGSYDIRAEDFLDYSAPFTSRDNIKKELTNAMLDTNPGSKQKKLEKIHIFQLGIALFNLATKHSPYPTGSDDFILPLSQGINTSRLTQELQKARQPEEASELTELSPYSGSQIEIITAMLSKKPIERPSLEEIQAVFPVELILTTEN